MIQVKSHEQFLARPCRSFRLSHGREVNLFSLWHQTEEGGWPDVFGRLRWDGLCPTITGGFDSFTRGRYGHPLHDRPLTPREAARIQGFPDSHHFVGNRGEVRSQIGNAVPPPVAFGVGTHILHSLLVADGILEEIQAYASLCEEETTYGNKAGEIDAA